MSAYNRCLHIRKISAISGVSSVSWLDDVLGKDMLTSTPLEFLDASITENYYKDGQALSRIYRKWKGINSGGWDL